MGTSDWISLISAILIGGGTLALAFMTWRSIRQTRNIQKSERRERLLNEVIEWAKEIRDISSANIDPSIIVLDSPVEQIATQHDFLYWYQKYQEVNANSEYVEEIAQKVFRGKLISVVRDVSLSLNDIIELLANCLINKAKENSEKVEKNKETIDSCAKELMREVAKLKTQALD